jgi:hypothetical protein
MESERLTLFLCYGLDSRGSIPGMTKIYLCFAQSKPGLETTVHFIQWILWAVLQEVKPAGT